MFTATPPKAPRTLTDDAEFSAAVAKLNDLKHGRTAMETELEAARLSRADGTPRGGIEDQARALLAGGTATETVASLETIGELTKTLRVQREAIAMQERVVATVREKVSRAMLEAAAPEYRRILADMAEVLAPVCALARKEMVFRETLEAQGISTAALYPCPWGDLRLDVYGSKVNRFLDDLARDHGITPKIDRRREPLPFADPTPPRTPTKDRAPTSVKRLRLPSWNG